MYYYAFAGDPIPQLTTECSQKYFTKAHSCANQQRGELISLFELTKLKICSKTNLQPTLFGAL